MIVKFAFLFLAFMAVLAMFGRLRIPKVRWRGASRCPSCGRHRIGTGRCPCGKERT